MDWLARLNSSERGGSLRVFPGLDGMGPRIAEERDCTLAFSGTLAKDVLDNGNPVGRDEELLLSAYFRHGSALFPRLRGQFMFMLVDRHEGVFYVVRDPMGCHPVFYAGGAETLCISPRAETVARRDGRKPELNRVAAAGFLLRTELEGEETLFAGVLRLLQGHVIEARRDRIEVKRYWFPSGDAASAPYEVNRFHGLLRQAVDRVVDESTAIYLSGGADSALVAAVLADVTHSRGLTPPVALSVAFRGSDANEEPMQREVASRLGLEHVLRTPAELVGPKGLLEAALELARTRTSRPPELLLSVYGELARLGGRTTILSGTGGDEWLLPPPGYAADRVVSLDALALVQLCRAWAGYWPGAQPRSAIAGVFWRSGLRSVARSLLASVAGRLAPGLPTRIRSTRAEQRIPPWVAPDEDLRGRLLARIVARTTPNPPGAVVDAQRRALLDADFLSITQERRHSSCRREQAPLRCRLCKIQTWSPSCIYFHRES